jgi:hypothetical protein
VSVPEVLTLAQHDHQVPLIPDQGCGPAAPADSLRSTIPSSNSFAAPDRGADDPHARGPEHSIERRREAGVPVVQHELRPRPGIFQVHKQVPCLLHDPGLDRVGYRRDARGRARRGAWRDLLRQWRARLLPRYGDAACCARVVLARPRSAFSVVEAASCASAMARSALASSSSMSCRWYTMRAGRADRKKQLGQLRVVELSFGCCAPGYRRAA